MHSDVAEEQRAPRMPDLQKRNHSISAYISVILEGGRMKLIFDFFKGGKYYFKGIDKFRNKFKFYEMDKF